MAKQVKSGLDKHVAEIRSRLQFGDRGYALYEATTRIGSLQRVLKNLEGTGDEELFRHFPVASVAALEAHFRATVSELVNDGGEYFERGLKLLGDKLKAVDIISMIHNKSITVGEVVAYSLPFSSLSHLVDVYSSVLGVDFKRTVSQVEDPVLARREISDRKPLIDDVPALWRGLSDAFEARHVLAHESAAGYDMDFFRASLVVNSVSKIIEAVDAVLWATAWKNKPITQYEMNVLAFKEYQASRVKLSEVIWAKRKEGDSLERRMAFNRLHLQWKKWYVEWCNFSADRFKGGSIRPMIFASNLRQSVEDRISEIEDMTGY